MGTKIWIVSVGLLAATRAPSPDIVLAPPQVEGDLGQENLARLRQSVAQSLGPSAVTDSSDSTACDEPVCAAELARSTGASNVVTVRVAVRGRDFETSVTLRDGQTGEPIASSERACDVCGVAEVSDLLAEQAAAMRRRVEVGAPAKLSFTTQPPGARVLVDGELVGVTPYEGTASVGAHRVKVELDGFISRTQELELVEGVVEKVHLELQPVPDDGPVLEPLQIGGVVALVLGVGATTAGSTFVALHHEPVKSQCTGDDIDDAGVCRYRFNGLPYGIPLLVGGLAGIATGVALLVVGAKRRKARRSALRPWGTGIEVRF